MINAIKFYNNVELFLFLFIINIQLSIEQYKTFNLKISLDTSELDPFFIIGYEQDKKCKEWVPSLINPTLFIANSYNESDMEYLEDYDFYLSYPFFLEEDKLYVQLFLYKLFNSYELFLLRPQFSPLIQKCYFGLSCGSSGYANINETHLNLNILGNTTDFPKKIFSFSNWTLNEDKDELKSFLYFGDRHQNFDSKDGVIGTCDANSNDPFWGCKFTNISFKNKEKSLLKDETNYYKIYFSSENHRIYIPKNFIESFNFITENACEEDGSDGLLCNFFEKEKDYAELKLIIENKMNITIQIDRMNRYIIQNENIDPNKTRIIIGEKDYFIFPLIMFKNFYVQFDAENYQISFYTTDKSILEVVEDKKKKNKGSKAGTVFLIILIILLLIALGFGIFWLLKKRRTSMEKNINKYNKFEDEDNFKDMNEKRVF